MTRRPALVLADLALLLVTSAPAARGTGSLALPRPAQLQATVDILAAPEYAGRRSGTPEGDRAAREIAGWLAEAGLRPGGDDGTWYQPFEVTTGVAVGEPCEIVVGDKGVYAWHHNGIEVVNGDGTSAKVTVGRKQYLLFRETDKPIPDYDEHHVQIYVVNFSGPHQRLGRFGAGEHVVDVPPKLAARVRPVRKLPG